MILIGQRHNLGRNAARRKREEAAIRALPHVDIPIVVTAKGFAPWSPEKLKAKRLARALRVWSKRNRNAKFVARARAVLAKKASAPR